MSTTTLDTLNFTQSAGEALEASRVLAEKIANEQIITRRCVTAGNNKVSIILGHITTDITTFLCFRSAKNQSVFSLGLTNFVIVQFMLIGFVR